MLNYCTKYRVTLLSLFRVIMHIRAVYPLYIGCAQVWNKTTDDNLFAFDEETVEKGWQMGEQVPKRRRSLLQCVINMDHLIEHHCIRANSTGNRSAY